MIHKTLLIASTLLLTCQAFALSHAEREDFIDRLQLHESRNKAHARGDKNKAWGILQIHAIMVRDANRIAGTNYRHEEMFDPQKAREVARIILTHYANHIRRVTGRPATEKHLAFIWNGGGSAWKRVDSPKNDEVQRNLENYYSRFTSR